MSVTTNHYRDRDNYYGLYLNMCLHLTNAQPEVSKLTWGANFRPKSPVHEEVWDGLMFQIENFDPDSKDHVVKGHDTWTESA